MPQLKPLTLRNFTYGCHCEARSLGRSNLLPGRINMEPIKIKICGIKTLDEALAAVEAGADYLGFNFYPPSPRYITPRDCARLQAGLVERGLQALAVGVFVNAPVESIARILDDCGLDLAQLSGAEPAGDLEALVGRAFKGIRPADQAAAQAEAGRYARRELSPALLVDAYHPGLYGGAGQAGDWALARFLADRYPILLAGGLNPENVALALDRVQPWGVDVASGVESAPGRKDPHKIAAFTRAVREYERKEMINAEDP
jgi:phosphoribosylanthranilate isomerase